MREKKLKKNPRMIMRNAVFMALLLPLVCVTLGSTEEITIEYFFENPTVQSVTILDNVYDRVVMEGAPNFGYPGHPALPARGVNILVPYGCEVTGIEIITDEKVLVGRGYNIEPVGHPYPLSADPTTITPPEPNDAIYNSTNPLPEARHKNIGVQNFRGYQYLVLRLHPVEYIPKSGELYYYPRMRVTVNTENIGKAAPLYRGMPEDEAGIISRVDNPDILSSYTSAPKHREKSYDLLIITTDAFVPYFEPLKDYHDTTGIPTEIHTTTTIGSTDPTDIRDYIRERYLNDGIQYVIIGGDDDIIPAVDLYVVSSEGADPYIEPNMPGDIYFGCLDGTYNYDGDAQWGEPTDGEGGGDVDLVAEVYVGRASASTAGDVYQFVLKTIAYLTCEDEYLNKTVLVGENLAFGGFGEYGGYSLDEIIDVSNAHGYTTYGHPSMLYELDKLYDLTYPGNSWPQSEIISRINSGVHIVNHYGHCNASWALKMTSTDVLYQFTNYDYCFIYSQGCMAGQFDDTECWAEHVHVFTDKGAFAAVMNARYGWGDYGTDGPSQRFDREFFDAIYNPAEAKPQLGVANQDSKEDNLYRIDEACMRWCYYQLHLFGDPTIAIKDVKGITFEYPAGIPEIVTAEQTTAFDVAVHGIGSGAPLAGSGQLHYTINGGDAQIIPMTQTKADNYQAVLPAIVCGDQLTFYVSAEEATNGRFYDPDTTSPHQVIVMKEMNTIFEDDFETDKGWTISGGLWARGIPTGQGGDDQQYPVPDPTGGCNGPNIYGYNLYGDYESFMSEMHLTSPAIDCSGKMNVQLNYCRWLGVEEPIFDHAYIRVSTNGTDWTDIWENPAVITDRDWNDITLDISSIADNQSTLYLRWTMGTSNLTNSYCGWNIDDVRIVSYQCVDFVCGDANDDESVNIFDITYIINYLYLEGPPPDPPEAADVNNDAAINIFDVTYLINHLYMEGPAPTCP